MANQSRMTYHEPKERFKKVDMNVIMKFEPIVVGIYCKLVTISSGKSLSIDFLSKKLGISKERMRKTIVFLESEGYITRKALHDDKGRMCGWDYGLYAEPVSKNERTKAGFKQPDLFETRVMDSPSYGKTHNTENPEHYNIDIDNNSTINSPVNEGIEKTSKDVKSARSLSEEEEVFIKKMKERYPRIMKMEKPLTLEEAKKLKKKFDADLIAKIMDEMENWKLLWKRCVSAYLTINNWCNKDLSKQ